MRPGLLVVVAGTGTGIGKTWVSVRVLERLVAAGRDVVARKAAQSYAPGETVTDADLLAGATGEDNRTVCPSHRWYALPMAPPMAAQALGRPVPGVQDLAREVMASWPDRPRTIGLVETAGGVASPQGYDGDASRLASLLDADLVVLVANATLGAINSVRLSCRALEPLPTVVYMNRFDGDDDLHQRNVAWLAGVDGLEVITELDRLVERIVGRRAATD